MLEIKPGAKVRLQRNQPVSWLRHVGDPGEIRSPTIIPQGTDGVVQDPVLRAMVGAGGQLQEAMRVSFSGLTPQRGVLVPLANLIFINHGA